ncbi:MAG: Uma2 family endonuclease [Candidatus Rokubacteria bacterium]|nr:Uma2 family endonuclease [Candidatus Rokubacteria bacterium]
MDVQLLRRRFSVEEYHRMGQAGVFSEDDRVELIEGEIIEMTPIGARHAACVRRLGHLFNSLLGQRITVSVQSPLGLGLHSEPQPDLALLRPRPDFYAQAHPGPEDVWLVVEVADTSVEFDRTVKIPLYARAGIPNAWLVDLSTETVEEYRDPTPDGYRNFRRIPRGETISLEAFRDVSLTVETILG